MFRRLIPIPLLVLIVALALTGCSRGARADEQGENAPDAAQASTASAGPALSVIAPHVAPAAPEIADNAGDATQSASTGESNTDASAAARLNTNHSMRPLPDRLVVGSLELDIPVEEIGWSRRPGANGSLYNQWEEAEYAAGWHTNSATPGEGDNVVLSGHNNIMGAVFRELDQLSRGDILTLYVNGAAHEYRVDRLLIVPETNATPEQRKENARFIQPTGSEQLTLVSCWPRDNNTHRIIVIASPIERS